MFRVTYSIGITQVKKSLSYKELRANALQEQFLLSFAPHLRGTSPVDATDLEHPV